MVDVASLKVKTKAVLDRLEKGYGRSRSLSDRPPLDQLLFLILQERWDAGEAMPAFEFLSSEFADWNDLRVAMPGELAAAIGRFSPPDALNRCKRMLQLLDHVFRERNKITLDFMLDWEEGKRHDYLAKLPMLSASVVHAFLQQLAPAGRLVVSPQALRVASRIGLITKTASLNVGRKAFESLLKETDWVRFQTLVTRHGDEICQAKVWYCTECLVNSLCKSRKVDSKKTKSSAN
jgi:endonuclease III